jgi:hypothetical protein
MERVVMRRQDRVCEDDDARRSDVVDGFVDAVVVQLHRVRVGAFCGEADGEGLDAVQVQAEALDPRLHATQRETGWIGAVRHESADFESVVVADAGAEGRRVRWLVTDGACAG